MAQRGRPRKPYPRLELHHGLERLLVEDERAFEWLTPEWLTAYRITFPEYWRRMREKLAGATTWAESTLARKSRLEVYGLTADTVDLLNYARWNGRTRKHKRSRRAIHRHGCFGHGAFIDPDEPREVNFCQFVLRGEELNDSLSVA